MSIANWFGRAVATVTVKVYRERVLALLGGLAIVGAIALAFSPVVPTALLDLSNLFDNQAVIGSIAVLVALVGLWEGYRWTEQSGLGQPFEQPPEEPTYRNVSHAGEDIDEPFEELTDIDASLSSEAYDAKERRVRLQLRETAVTVVADTMDISVQDARERVDDGSWTDDPRVAAFLGPKAPRLPLDVRIEDWFSGDAFERTVRQTIDEIERLADLPTDETEEDRDSQETAVEDDFTRGGGVTAGNIPLTDASQRQSTTLTAADAEETRSSRWNVGLLVAFVLSGAGFVLSNTALVLGAVIALAYVGYGYATRAPAMAVEVTRAVSDTSPVPGEPVDVVLTVENVGGHPIPELRVVDGVPADLNVDSGTPRGCDSLRPEESVTLTYTVDALRGTHQFDPVTVWTRNVSASVEREATADLDCSIQCRDPLEEMTIRGNTTPYTGQIPTNDGGQGVEFHATREYQSTDPLKQLDWNYWARTGEPRTIEFRQHRAADVVVLLDDRSVARCSRDEYTPDAVTLGQHAALRVADALLDESNAVGVATLKGRAFVAPGRGRDQLRHIEQALRESSVDSNEHGPFGDIQRSFFRHIDEVTEDRPDVGAEATSPTGHTGTPFIGDGGSATTWLRKRLPANAQVVFITPLLDDLPGQIARRLKAEDNDVMILSPNVTTTETPGGTVARIERHERIRALRARKFKVADWPAERPLSVALERAKHRWSQ